MFPVSPYVGQRYTADNGQEYSYTLKGGWRSLEAQGGRSKQIPYTASVNAPLTPHLGDQWFDLNEMRLKTWSNNGSYSYWRAVATNAEGTDSSKITLIAERTLPLMWNYGEQNFAFEVWSTDPQYSWRDTNPIAITRAVAGDDTLEVETTATIRSGSRYAITSSAGTTLAYIDVFSVLGPTTIRTRVDLAVTISAAMNATLSRTSFDVRSGYALVSDKDVFFTKPLTALQTNFKGRLRLRRSAEGRGAFTISVRRPGTDAFEPVTLLETTTPAVGYRDEIYAIDRTGPIELNLLFSDSSGLGDRIEHLMLYPAPQSVDNRRVELPLNLTPLNQDINISTTPTLVGSAFRSLYNLPQNGAEFQIATDAAFTNLIVNSSSDFLASWVNSATPGAINYLVFQDSNTVYAVGPSGKVYLSTDAGKTYSTVATAGSITSDLQGVAASGTTFVIVGDLGIVQYSVAGGTLTTVSPAGGYTGQFSSVSLAADYGIIVGANGEIQRTVNNKGGIYAKAPVDNNYTGQFHDVDLLTNGRAIVVGTNGEIQTSSDFGATWTKRTQAGNYTGVFYGVDLLPDGHAVAVGSSGEIQTSDNYGSTWVRRTAANSYTGTFQHVRTYDKYAVAVGNNGEIQTSDNYGATWSKRTTPGASTANLLTAAFSPTGENVLIAGVSTVFKPLKLEGSITSYAVPSGNNLLDINRVYYWRVRYQDSAGFWSEYSKPTVFATKATLNAVAAPTNLSPAKDAQNISVLPVLQATPFAVLGDADTHNGSQWQISAGSTFGTVLVDSGTVAAATSYTLDSANRLTDKTTYSWRVRYRGTNNGFGPWSTPTAFTAVAKPNTPAITSSSTSAAPDDNIAFIISAFSSVVSGDTATKTVLELSKTSGFEANSLIRTITVTGSPTRIAFAKQITAAQGQASLQSNTFYYARVMQYGNIGGASDYSATHTFKTPAAPVAGEAVYTTQGQYYFTVPEGITSVCAVVVGGGGGSAMFSNGYGWGGGGGGLTWKNNIPVTPGQVIQVEVGLAGQAGFAQNAGSSGAQYEAAWGRTRGGTSSFGNFISATGGRSYVINSEKGYGEGGTFLGGDGGGNGGYAGEDSLSHATGGGGGAGGYNGNGGNGKGPSQGNGSSSLVSGGGGGGAYGANRSCGGGGGVGLYGQSNNGLGGTTASGNNGGGGGSGGGSGMDSSVNSGGYANGGDYGGGAGGVANGTTSGGGGGAVRIIWGPNRSFPNNAQ